MNESWLESKHCEGKNFFYSLHYVQCLGQCLAQSRYSDYLNQRVCKTHSFHRLTTGKLSELPKEVLMVEAILECMSPNLILPVFSLPV